VVRLRPVTQILKHEIPLAVHPIARRWLLYCSCLCFLTVSALARTGLLIQKRRRPRFLTNLSFILFGLSGLLGIAVVLHHMLRGPCRVLPPPTRPPSPAAVPNGAAAHAAPGVPTPNGAAPPAAGDATRVPFPYPTLPASAAPGSAAGRAPDPAGAGLVQWHGPSAGPGPAEEGPGDAVGAVHDADVHASSSGDWPVYEVLPSGPLAYGCYLRQGLRCKKPRCTTCMGPVGSAQGCMLCSEFSVLRKSAQLVCQKVCGSPSALLVKRWRVCAVPAAVQAAPAVHGDQRMHGALHHRLLLGPGARPRVQRPSQSTAAPPWATPAPCSDHAPGTVRTCCVAGQRLCWCLLALNLQDCCKRTTLKCSHWCLTYAGSGASPGPRLCQGEAHRSFQPHGAPLRPWCPVAMRMQAKHRYMPQDWPAQYAIPPCDARRSAGGICIV